MQPTRSHPGPVSAARARRGLSTRTRRPGRRSRADRPLHSGKCLATALLALPLAVTLLGSWAWLA
jgi:hypothetical protein